MLMLVVAAEFGGGSWVVATAVAAQTTDFDVYDKELDALDSKIQDHLKRAREASFWKQPNSSNESAPAVQSIKAPTSNSNFAATHAKAAPTPQAPIKVAGPSAPASVPAPGPSFAPASGSAPASNPNAGQILNQNYQTMNAIDQNIASRTQVSGTYRTGFGVGHNRNFSGNDSNSDLADRDFHYLFGDRIYDTFDPAIYSQYKLDIYSQITKETSFFAEIVADPWSYVGQTSEIVVPDVDGENFIRIKQKYWGPNNSTVPQTAVRSNGQTSRDRIGYPVLEAHDGKTQAFTASGYSNLLMGAYNVPEQDIDYEFRPLRKIWLDDKRDIWHFRVFGLADQNQVMTSDDPLHLSNEKDYWQHSGWLDEWKPVQRFEANPFLPERSPIFLRGHYDTADAFYAKDSSGNYLTLLRGVAAEANWDNTYLGMMTASRFGLWDEYQDFNNIPGVVRLKHNFTEAWMVGSTYTHRVGLIDNEPDAFNQVTAIDTRYNFNSDDFMYAEVAYSRNSIDRQSSFQYDHEGFAHKVGIVKNTGDLTSGTTRWNGDFTWMDTKFRETLSKYESLRDDEHWSQHISWAAIPPGLEPFKIGTGVDYGRYVTRLNVASSIPDKGVDNLFDIRHVRDSDSSAITDAGNDGDESHIETVIRDETTWKFLPEWTFKNFMRFHILPPTRKGVEPFTSGFNTPGVDTSGFWDPSLESSSYYANSLIEPDLNANRRSFGWGLQYEPRPAWTFQGDFTRTNAIPDFPRGLLNDSFQNSVIRDPETPNIWLDRLQPFLYNQHVFGLPSYDYFSIMKERILYKPTDEVQFTFHAAQNSYRLWGPSDENVNHQGISMDWQFTDTWSMFFDYTHTKVADVAKLLSTNLAVLEFDDHHNIYSRLRYRINSSTFLTMEYGVFGNIFGEGSEALPTSEYETSTFNLPTIDTEHLFRMSLDGEF